jgi:hypothetical protein
MSLRSVPLALGICLGLEYQFSVRAVRSPMAYRARAYLAGNGAISGFGNTREDAVGSMQDRVRAYVEDRIARNAWA